MDLLALAPADIREALRRLGRQNRSGHPLLETRLVTLNLQELGYPDTIQHRWWAFGAALDRAILDSINELRGADLAISREALRRSAVDERARLLLDPVRHSQRADLAMWTALYCQYILPGSTAVDLPDLAGVHRRTWQRWLSDGHAVLLQHLQALEAEASVDVSGSSAELLGKDLRRAAAAGAPVGLSAAGWGEDAPGWRSGPAPLLPGRGRLIGRAAELAALTQLLLREEVWLVTLTGPGGVGKSRLALAAAEALRGRFRDAPLIVPLSHLHEPTEVLASLSLRLGLRITDTQEELSSVASALGDRPRLLVVDGFERFVDAGCDLAALAGLCPSLKVLVTSRVVLQVYGEQVITVAPLGVPGPDDLSAAAWPRRGTEWIQRFPAVELFVDRAKALQQDFRLTEENCIAVGQICAQLDGLPLAIELAARQIDVFSPRALASRIPQALDLLIEGPRDQPASQQSLRQAFASSYEILSASEQIAFRRLAAFSGGFTLETAAAVCRAAGGLDDADILPIVRSLVRASLVYPRAGSDNEPRFGMLDTLREFGLACLAHAGDETPTRQAHALAYSALVEQRAQSGSGGERHSAWLARVDRDYRNIQAALHWCFDGGAPLVGVRLAVDLGDYWHLRGYIAEANAWLQRAVEIEGVADSDPLLRLQLLNTAGRFLTEAGRHAEARRLQEDCVPIARASGDLRLIASAHANLGVTGLLTGEYRLADVHLRLALNGFRELGDPSHVARALLNLAIAASYAEDLGAARSWAQQALEAYEAAGDEVGIGRVLDVFAWITTATGDLVTAADLYRQSLAIARAQGAAPHRLPPLVGLGTIAFIQGDAAAAASYWAESLSLCQASGQDAIVAEPLSLIAAAVAAPVTSVSLPPDPPAPPLAPPPSEVPADQLKAAVRLLSVAQATLDRTGHVLHPGDQRRIDNNLAKLRASLDPTTFGIASVQGRSLTLDEACAEAQAALDLVASGTPARGAEELPSPVGDRDAATQASAADQTGTTGVSGRDKAAPSPELVTSY